MNSSKTPQINQKPSDIASKPKSIVSKAKPKVKPAPKLSFDLKLKIIDDSKKKWGQILDWLKPVSEKVTDCKISKDSIAIIKLQHNNLEELRSSILNTKIFEIVEISEIKANKPPAYHKPSYFNPMMGSNQKYKRFKHQ